MMNLESYLDEEIDNTLNKYSIFDYVYFENGNREIYLKDKSFLAGD